MKAMEINSFNIISMEFIIDAIYSVEFKGAKIWETIFSESFPE